MIGRRSRKHPELGAEQPTAQLNRPTIQRMTIAAGTPSMPSLVKFVHAVGFSREAFDDDRTLVAVWPRKQPPSQTGGHTRQTRPFSAEQGLR